MLLNGLFATESQQIIKIVLKNYNDILIAGVPFMYLYFENMVENSKKIQFRNINHLIIPISFLIIHYLIDQSSYEIPNLKFYYYLLFTIYAAFYLFITYNLLNNEIWNRKSEIRVIIKQNQLIKNWSIYMFSIIIIVAIRLILTIFLEIKEQSFNFGASYLWISALLWLILFFKIIISPEILYGYTFLTAKIDETQQLDHNSMAFWINDSKVKITNTQDYQLFEKIKEDLSGYIQKVDSFSLYTDSYRNSKFSLTDLSDKLNIPKSHLAFLFKYNSKISFSEYKNIIRIIDGLSLIKAGYLNSNNYELLAKEIGFQSYNTFFVSFKDVSGVTPQDFLAQFIRNNKG